MNALDILALRKFRHVINARKQNDKNQKLHDSSMNLNTEIKATQLQLCTLEEWLNEIK